MFVDDIVLIIRGGCRSPIDDLRLFGQDWGFRLADVRVPVRWWHGDTDQLVPLAAQAAVSRLPDAELILRGATVTSAASPGSSRCSSSVL
ncbi:hypothetical protein [Mycobacterium decipiens]|uniref:hypothetical protein n=1 Tax=Mycobacterium decipiens TaxID=1430326 RepID=UPI0026845C46